ncbi:hypothetical protein LINPERHAP2_LOCUS3713, partial [Linum perenne]
ITIKQFHFVFNLFPVAFFPIPITIPIIASPPATAVPRKLLSIVIIFPTTVPAANHISDFTDSSFLVGEGGGRRIIYSSQTHSALPLRFTSACTAFEYGSEFRWVSRSDDFSERLVGVSDLGIRRTHRRVESAFNEIVVGGGSGETSASEGYGVGRWSYW